MSKISNVVVQISFSNPEIIPSWMQWVDNETERLTTKRTANRRNPWGEILIEPSEKTEMCDTSKLVPELVNGGYRPIGAHWQRRNNTNSKKGRPPFFFTIFLVFSNDPNKKPLSEPEAEGIEHMLEFAYWRVGAYRNPQEGGDGKWISITLTARAPRFDGGDPEKPIEHWIDRHDRKLGKQPIRPTGGTLCFDSKEGVPFLEPYQPTNVD